MALALTAPELRAQDTLIVKVSLRTTDFSFETQDGYDDLNVPASLLSTGTYFLRLESKAKAKTEKIIKGGN